MTRDEGRSRRFDYEGLGKFLLEAVRTFMRREGLSFMHGKGSWDRFAQWIRSDKTLSPWDGTGTVWSTRHRFCEYRFSPEGVQQKVVMDKVWALAKERGFSKPKIGRVLHRSPSSASKKMHTLIPLDRGDMESLANLLDVKVSAFRVRVPKEAVPTVMDKSKAPDPIPAPPQPPIPPQPPREKSTREPCKDDDPVLRLYYVGDIIEQAAKNGQSFTNVQLRSLDAYLKSGGCASAVLMVVCETPNV